MKSDALRRGARTLIDIAFVQAIVQALYEFEIVAWTAEQRAILVTLATFVVSAAKNAAEDRGAIPALMKAPASDGENPVPEPDPQDWVNASLADQRKRALGD